MRTILTLFLVACMTQFSIAQSTYKMATLNEDGTLSVQSVELDYPQYLNPTDVSPIPFMKFRRAAFAYSKNTRGLTLADLDMDGVEELLIGINNKFYAIKGDGTLLFEVPVNGPILYPPAVADIDGDGDLEIAVNCGFATTQSGVYLIDHQGVVMPGWPKTFSSSLVMNAPTMADLNGDGQLEILSTERVTSDVGLIHAYTITGEEMDSNWPFDIGSIPCFTTSVGDINNDGVVDVITAGYNTGLFAIGADGVVLPGFPVYDESIRYSYQSPILVDLDGDGNRDIVGATHGDAAGYYARNNDGTYLSGWPRPINNWTYAPPTVADVNGDGVLDSFFGNPNQGANPMPTIYGIEPDGQDLDNFPISKIGGNEGVISIADVNDDGVFDLIFGSNITDTEGFGFLHAFSSDGSGEISGFPLRPKGYTFLNGAVLGDVDNDGMMDLSLDSYDLYFGAQVDSLYVTSYSLNVPYDESKILVNGYKGGNDRDGLYDDETMGTADVYTQDFQVYPNPSNGELNIKFKEKVNDLELKIFNLSGKIVYQKHDINLSHTKNIQLSHLPPGTYILYLNVDGVTRSQKWIKK